MRPADNTALGRWTRAWLYCSGFGAAWLVAMLALAMFAKPLLYIENEPTPADVIVVLGGDAGDRAFRTLELFKRGLAKNVIVSGAGDCELIRDRLVLAGVPPEHVQTECASRSTMDNASAASRLFEQASVHSAIIVTSWFHARRALSCFRAAAPNVRTQSVPSYHGVDMKGKPGLFEIPWVIAEYLKIAWYWARYRIEMVEA